MLVLLERTEEELLLDLTGEVLTEVLREVEELREGVALSEELVDVRVVVAVEVEVLEVEGVTVPRVVTELLREVEDVEAEPVRPVVTEAVREPVVVAALVREPVTAAALVREAVFAALERIVVPVEAVREAVPVAAVRPTLVAVERLTPAAATRSL